MSTAPTWADREALALIGETRRFFARAARTARFHGLDAEARAAVNGLRAKLELAAIDADAIPATGARSARAGSKANPGTGRVRSKLVRDMAGRR